MAEPTIRQHVTANPSQPFWDEIQYMKILDTGVSNQKATIALVRKGSNVHIQLLKWFKPLEDGVGRKSDKPKWAPLTKQMITFKYDIAADVVEQTLSVLLQFQAQNHKILPNRSIILDFDKD